MNERPATFQDALQILDTALSKQSLPNLSPLISDEVLAAKVAVGTSVNSGIDSGVEQVMEFATSALAQAESLGLDLEAIQKQAKENPWPFIAGAALGGLALGALLGYTSNKTAIAAPVPSSALPEGIEPEVEPV